MDKLDSLIMIFYKRNWYFKTRLSFIALLLCFFQFAYAQSELIDYAEFLPDRYTSNFKRGFKATLIGSGTIDKEKISVNMSITQDAGVVGSFAGKQWVKVNSSGKAKLGSESANISMLQLYDI